MKKIVVALLVVFALLPARGLCGDKIELKDTKYRWIELDYTNSYKEYSWQVVVKNNTTRPQRVRIEFVLLDKDGFQLKHSTKIGVIAADKTRTFRDKHMISTNLAKEVTQYEVITTAR